MNAACSCLAFHFGGDEFLLVSVQSPARALSTLTGAERDVVCGVLDQETNREIAARRGSSTRTVANQLAAVFRKLGVGSRAELINAVAGGGHG
ncbi:MAG: helix-turn-helix transcriptional regulator [Myxococcales bacterium]|nr:helix-turn-helix transcriptional regulator [Myxococcales bacterium]